MINDTQVIDAPETSPAPEDAETTLYREIASPIPSIVKVLEALINLAVSKKASDIHIDPVDKHLRVRVRVDGVLIDLNPFPLAIHPEIISRIKILSSLRTDEHFAAQDGRFKYNGGDTTFDVRVSITPTYYGENAVLRLLINTAGGFTLASLGFSEMDQNKILSAISKPHGMILATGPTGSGKTTTLYTLLSLRNIPDVSIVTIEDPIEYSIEGIKQIQVNPRTGLTFATGLRSVLRQDPDIIMVGEIRDQETANIAVNTALTGHLLFSSLHTNDAATTLPRLIDMGVDPYLVATTMQIALAQRLVRKLCPKCKVKEMVNAPLKKSLERIQLVKPLAEGETHYTAKGCSECGSSGYKGRITINEVLVASPAIRELIMQEKSSGEIKELARAEGMTTMFDDGIEKVRAGTTSVSEILRVTAE